MFREKIQMRCPSFSKYKDVHFNKLFTSIWKGGPSPAGGGHEAEEWPSDASLFHNRGLELSPYLWTKTKI